MDDLIEGICRFMFAAPDLAGPLNLGNPGEMTVIELARRIIDLTGSRSRVVHRPIPVDDPTRRCPDIGLAKTTLGWSPRTPLDEGLRRTIAWFDQMLSEAEPVTELSGVPA